jgi:hypothetical protein
MSRVTLSYTDALRGIINADDMEGVLGLVENHKNWGAFSARMPSYIVVALVDAVKRLKEEASGPADELPEEIDDFDGLFDEDVPESQEGVR